MEAGCAGTGAHMYLQCSFVCAAGAGDLAAVASGALFHLQPHSDRPHRSYCLHHSNEDSKAAVHQEAAAADQTAAARGSSLTKSFLFSLELINSC